MKSQLVALGSTMVALGIIFSDDSLIGYSLIGAGVLLAVFSTIKLRRNA